MKDGLQNVSFDRLLMRAKDVALLLGFLSSCIWTAFIAFRFIDRMNERLTRLEARVADVQGGMKK